MKRTNKKGFTIVELVIVIAIIAVLAAVLIPTFANVVKKAKESADNQTAKNLNTILATEYPTSKPANFSEVIDVLGENGYNITSLIPKSNRDLVWNQSENKFESIENPSSPEQWVVVAKAGDFKANASYSQYLAYEATGAISVKAGVDVGNNNVDVTYETVDAQNVIIRTNGGTLTINAPAATVHHYGAANVVDIQKVAETSYYEHETATFIKLAKGRVVVEESAEIGQIFIPTTTETVIIATRDKAELPAVASKDAAKTVTIQTLTGTSNTAATTKTETPAVATEEEAKASAAANVVPSFDEQYAACIGWTPYFTLEAAFDAAKVTAKTTPVTINLLRDCAGNGLALYNKANDKDMNITIDFRSYSYDVNANTEGSTGTKTQAFHLEKDNDITLKNGTLKTTSSTALMLVQNYCNLTLDNMVIDGRNPNAVVSYALSNNNGTILIKDTTIIAGNNQVAFDVCRYASYPSVSVTVEGKSVINGKIELSVSNKEIKDGAFLYLNGGNFSAATIVSDRGTGEYVDVYKASDVSITLPDWVNSQ